MDLDYKDVWRSSTMLISSFWNILLLHVHRRCLLYGSSVIIHHVCLLYFMDWNLFCHN